MSDELEAKFGKEEEIENAEFEEIVETEEVSEKDVVSSETEEEESEEKEESKKIEPEMYEKARLEDDGFLGIPIFTENELEILFHNLFVEPENVKFQQDMMRSSLDVFIKLKDMKDKINLSEEDADDDKQISNSENLYNSSRNLLINYQKSIDEYIAFVNDNKDEILKTISEDAESAIKAYIEKASEEFGVEYKENSLLNFITCIALKRATRDVENDNLLNILLTPYSADYDPRFEQELNKINSSIKFFVNNNSRQRSVKNPGKDEIEILRICTNIVKKFRKISNFEESELFDNLKSPKSMVMEFMYNLSRTVRKSSYYKFIDEKKIYIKKNKKYKKRLGKYSDNYPPLHLHDNFVKARLNLIVIEMYLKRWFSISLFGDVSVLDDKNKFVSVIGELDDKFTKSEVFISFINTLSFRLIFNELGKIIGELKAVTGKELNVKQVNDIKNYIAFVSYYRNSVNYIDYGFKETYSDYVKALLETIDKRIKKG